MSLLPANTIRHRQSSADDSQRGGDVLRLDSPFYVGAALRLGRRPLSPEALDRLSKSLKRLAAGGDATAPIALAWLLQKQVALAEGR